MHMNVFDWRPFENLEKMLQTIFLKKLLHRPPSPSPLTQHAVHGKSVSLSLPHVLCLFPSFQIRGLA